MTTSVELTDLSDEQLADQITTWAGRIAAGEARLLLLIAEFDRREAWGGPGLLSCAHWLSWRLGLGLTAARERVRVARALRELPLTTQAIGAGRMSWSQLRAVTRVATAEDEQVYLDLARSTTGAQLERLVRGVRRARKPAEDAADPELAAWRMRTTARYDDDGLMVITTRARVEDGAVVMAALEQIQAELDSRLRAADHAGGAPPEQDCPRAEGSAATVDVMSARSSAEASGVLAAVGPSTPPSVAAVSRAAPAESMSDESSAEGPPEPRVKATLGDALLEMARGALARQVEQRPGAARRQRFRLTAQVDPLSGWARLADGELLPPTGVRQALAPLPRFSLDTATRTDTGPSGSGRSRRSGRSDGDVVALRPLTPADLTVADLGRTTRQPSLRLRELLGTVDGERCRFPGCTRHRNLHAHHVVHWSAGGPTDLANLVLLCERHHTVVHAQGFGLVLHTDRRLTVTTADGTGVLHHPALPWQPAEHLDQECLIDAATLPPDQVEARMDLGYVVSVLAQHAA